MNRAGRSRNARLNQAIRHTSNLLELIAKLSHEPMNKHVDDKDAWQDARNALEQLVQCFHEANAYNNMTIAETKRKAHSR